MERKTYKAVPLSVTKKEAFTEASREELRVLIAIIEADGKPLSTSELAAASGVSEARTKSAVALWEAEGVISVSENQSNIVYEFEETISHGEISEVAAVSVAKSVRDNNLECVLRECAKIMNRPSLSTYEIKNISALYTQYSLSAEYILTLAAHLAVHTKKLTSVRLRDKAIELVEMGCDDAERLSVYIEDAESSSGDEWEMKRLFGIYNRNLTKSEKNYFKRWTEELGYFSEIISEAFDIAVLNTGKASLPYIDKILTAWHGAGCKTAAECKAYSDRDKKSAANDRGAKKSSAEGKRKPEPKPPKYGNFDPNEAFLAALERSYSADDK